MSDLLNEFISGVFERCKQAGLSDDNTDIVCGYITQAIELRDNTKKAEQSDWRDKLYDYALNVPTPVMTGALSGLASVPLTAMFGRRDEKGKKKYFRNALIASAGGAALPFVYKGGPVGRFESDKQYRAGLRGVAEEANNLLPIIDAEKKKLPADFSKITNQDDKDLYQQLYALENQYVTDVIDPADRAVQQFGTPGSRWRQLFSSTELPPTKFKRLNDLIQSMPE